MQKIKNSINHGMRHLLANRKVYILAAGLGLLSFVLGFKSKVIYDPARIYCGLVTVDIKDLHGFSANEFENHSGGDLDLRQDITVHHLFGAVTSGVLLYDIFVCREGDRIVVFGFADDEASALERARSYMQYVKINRFSGATDE